MKSLILKVSMILITSAFTTSAFGSLSTVRESVKVSKCRAVAGGVSCKINRQLKFRTSVVIHNPKGCSWVATGAVQAGGSVTFPSLEMNRIPRANDAVHIPSSDAAVSCQFTNSNSY